MGIASQIAPETWEDKESLTPMRPTPIDQQTIADESTVEAIDRRSRETKNASLTTLDRVERLRVETREDINAVNRKIDAHGDKLDGVIKVVGDLGVKVGAQHGQNEVIIEMLKEQRATRENTERVVTTTTIYEAEVDKTRQLSDIEVGKQRAITEIADEKAVRDLRRELIKMTAIKVLAAIGIAWAFFTAIYFAR